MLSPPSFQSRHSPSRRLLHKRAHSNPTVTLPSPLSSSPPSSPTKDSSRHPRRLLKTRRHSGLSLTQKVDAISALDSALLQDNPTTSIGPNTTKTLSLQSLHQLPPPPPMPKSPTDLMAAGGSHAVSTPTTFPSIPTAHPSPDSHPKRPDPPLRSSSFQKRHASFDSPREVPLPSPSLLSSSRMSFFSNPNEDIPPPRPEVPPFHMDTKSPMGRYQSHSRSHTASSHISTETERPRLQACSPSWCGPSCETKSTTSSSDRLSGSPESLSDPYGVFEDDDDSHMHRSGSGSAETSPEPSPISGSHEKGIGALSGVAGSVRKGSTSDIGEGQGQYDVASAHSGKMGMPSEDFTVTRTTYKGKGKAVETTSSMSGPVFPNSRPYSLPAAVPNPNSTTDGVNTTSTQSQSHRWIDRSSSASLPLPTHTPYHALPRASDGKDETVQEGVEWHARAQADDSSRRDAIYGLHSFERPPLESTLSSSSTDSSDSASSLPTEPPIPQVPGQLALSRAALGIPPDLYMPHSAPIASRTYSSPNSTRGLPPSGPAVPPQPLAHTQSHSPRLTQSFWQYTSRAVNAPASTSSSSSPGFGVGYSSSSTPALPSTSSSSRPPSMSGVGSARPNLSPSEPPVILPPSSTEGDDVSMSGNAPYAPFLCRMPPPPDSWIEVETSAAEYKLVVSLPGFRRDGITLATKRRRILHLVADSWEQNGGHFERRISFGYDADLTQVRAEFDGTILKVSIPRRVPAISLWGGERFQATPGAQ